MSPAAVAPARTAPPTTRGEMIVRSPRRSKWPGVLGIACIVVGAGGLLIHGWGVVQNLFFNQHIARLSGQAEMFAVMKKWSAPMALTSATSALLAALLIWGGVQLLRKRAGSRGVLLTWAVVRVLQGIGAAVVMGLMQEEQMRASMVTASSPGGPPAAVIGMAIGSATGGLAMATYALWAMALPVFVLVWMMLPRVRREIGGWRNEERR